MQTKSNKDKDTQGKLDKNTKTKKHVKIVRKKQEDKKTEKRKTEKRKTGKRKIYKDVRKKQEDIKTEKRKTHNDVRKNKRT